MRVVPARLAALALLAGCAGCSLVAVRRPPPAPPAPDVPLECTRSRTAPVLDTVGAIATPLLGLTTWGLCAFAQTMQSWSSTPQQLGCDVVLWGTLLGTAAYGGSAVYGYRATGACRRLAAERATSPEPPAHPLPPSLAPGPPR